MSNKLQNVMSVIRQGVKYSFVGGTCTILDFLILYLGAECLGYPYLIISAVSFSFGVLLNYFLCRYFVFDFHVVNNSVWEFVWYVIISLVGLLINVGIIYLVAGILGNALMLAKLVASSVTLFWNFFARRFFLHTS